MSALPTGNWSVQLGENNASATIRKQEVHTGPTGLNIPTLDPITATDVQINAAMASLDTAQTILASRRTALGADASAIAQSQSTNKDVALVHQKDAENAIAADMTAAGAEYKSTEVKHELALQAVVNLTDMRSQLIELLR
jgi:flagellin-like hook-associated protein FlgL